jgi:hypothetical protein
MCDASLSKQNMVTSPATLRGEASLNIMVGDFK